MKLADLDRVNHLVTELADMKTLQAMAEAAEPAAFQLFIEAPGDSSLRISLEGASTTHSRGLSASEGFLLALRTLAVEELRARRLAVLTELRALGVEPEE
jgi:hypothetical protein